MNRRKVTRYRFLFEWSISSLQIYLDFCYKSLIAVVFSLIPWTNPLMSYAASIATMDSAIGSMDQWYGPGSGWAESFGMMDGN